MTTSPYAQVKQVINAGAPVFGGQTISGGNAVQLSGVSTVGWENQLWEIYEYPTGFSVPSGWTNVNGIYQSNSVTPTVINIPAASTLWGKYLWRLTVNGGLLNGIYMGPLSTQPLVDEASGVQVLSPNALLYDIAYRESNQFDSVRQWIGQWKLSLRALDTFFSRSNYKSLTSDFTTTSASAVATNLSFAAAASDVWLVEFEGTVQCSSTGGVKASFTLPTGATIEGFAIGGSTGVTAMTSSRITAGSTLTSAFAAVATTPLFLNIRARIKGNGVNSGNITLNFASTTGGQTTTVFAGSAMKAQRLTEV